MRYRMEPPACEPLVAEALEEFGWNPTEGSDWTLLWKRRFLQPKDLAGTSPQQRVNRFGGNFELGNKIRLAHNLTQHRQLMARRSGSPPYDFFPETFLLPVEYGALRKAAGLDPSAIWIRKPGARSRGRGVRLITDVDKLSVRPAVVQRYVQRPHLKNGFKYELRVYVALTSLDPLVVYMYDDGLVKLTSRPYTTDRRQRSDRVVHLINRNIQALNREAVVGENTVTFPAHREWLRSQGIDDEAVFSAIRGLIIRTFAAVREPMLRWSAVRPCPATSFELFGLDILLDADLKPWLLEVNFAPSLKVQSGERTDAARSERAVKENLVRDLLRLAGIEGPPRPDDSSDEAVLARFDAELARSGGFQRIYPAEDAASWLPCLTWLRRADRLLARRVCPKTPLNPPRLRPRAMRALPLGEGLVLVSEENALVRALNPTAGYAWLRIEEGAPIAEIVQELAERFDQPLVTVRTDVDAAVAEWIESDLMNLSADSAVKRATQRNLRLALSGVALEVRLPEDAVSAVGTIALEGHGNEPVVGAVEVVPSGKGYVLRTSEGLAMICDQPAALGPLLRSMLIQRAAYAPEAHLALPASAIRCANGAVLIAGTDNLATRLALACSLADMGIFCSDLSLLDADFNVLGNTLPPALYGHDVAEFEPLLRLAPDAPIHYLPGGVPVRYLPPLASTIMEPALPIVALVFPVRGQRRRTRLTALDPCTALERLIALGLLRFPTPDADALEPLVAKLDGLPCQELEIADLQHGVQVLRKAHA